MTHATREALEQQLADTRSTAKRQEILKQLHHLSQKQETAPSNKEDSLHLAQ